MAVDKMSISFAPELAADVRAAAEDDNLTVSAWLAEASAERLRRKALKEYLDDYEADHGAFTEEELAQAAEDLGFARERKCSAR